MDELRDANLESSAGYFPMLSWVVGTSVMGARSHTHARISLISPARARDIRRYSGEATLDSLGKYVFDFPYF